jgi:hypothetical protein
VLGQVRFQTPPEIFHPRLPRRTTALSSPGRAGSYELLKALVRPGSAAADRSRYSVRSGDPPGEGAEKPGETQGQ